MTTKITAPIVCASCTYCTKEPNFIIDTTLHEAHDTPTRILAIVIRGQQEDLKQSEARLEELQSLITTMKAQTVASLIIPLRSIHPATLIGSGKVAELAEIVEESNIECIVFDHDISPRAQRNLEEMTSVAVIDRQEVILQIFSDRAATREATLQVALARMEYSLPRLTRKWTHLSRQQGGAKGTRGEGETQLEIDRRIVTNRIVALKDELKKVEAQRTVQRKNRLSSTIPTAAVVGYTNAGKSSLLNLLCASDVLVEDKLFATLDPITRKLVLPHKSEMLLTDTVGFISNLPHQLVDAFKSTLEEAQFNDFIVHVCDASQPDMLSCFDTTMEVLESLGCGEKPMVVFINKMDAVHNEFAIAKIVERYPKTILGSVKQKMGIDELALTLEAKANQTHPERLYHFPNNRHDLVALIRNNGTLIDVQYLDDWIAVRARVPERLVAKLEAFASLA